ncbi:MAG TPA: hypothetical protein VMW41_01180 [Candidatus Bathyarchaeia archaeon]|nr:hypothetical protein [Candidatus Bathyarchaeia archaeon]
MKITKLEKVYYFTTDLVLIVIVLIGIIVSLISINRKVSTLSFDLARHIHLPASPTPKPDVRFNPMNWKKYTSKLYGITLRYPRDVEFTASPLFDKEFLSVKNENGYMTLQSGCRLSQFPNFEDRVSVGGIMVDRFWFLKSGRHNIYKAEVVIKESPNIDKKECIDISMGLKPEKEEETRQLFDFILNLIEYRKVK